MKRYTSLLFAILLVLGTSSLWGQATASSTVQGTVTDKSQAIVPGANVTITSKATGTSRTAKTDDTGSYRFNLLPAGDYTVKVQKEGFATFLQNASLLVGQTTTANAILQPGATSQTVEVTADAPVIDVTKTSVSQQITPREVEDLPLVGRDAANLAYLAPGVKAADSYDPTKSRYAVMSINGGDGRNVNVTVNGIDNKDNTVGGPVMQLPLEAVQEFQISTQRFSAENGRSQGAAINMITKSGTNNYHGSLFGYFRDSALNTDEKQANGDGTQLTAHPDYSRQFFGGSVGGPVIKDKLFGFFAIERERESQGLTESGKAFTELTLAAANGFAAQPAAVIPRPFYEWRYNGRLDWNINSKNTAYVSYSSQANNSLNDQSDGTGDLTNGNFTVNHLQVANLTLNSVLSPSTVNQFTFGFQYWNNLIDSDINVPLVTFPSASFGTNGNVPQQSFQRKWQFRDDISKTIGRHTLKAGVDFIHTPVQGGFFKFNQTLEIDFNKNPSSVLADPASYPQKFATPGLISGMSYSTGDPSFIVAAKQLGFYFQDDWKVTPRLTLNLGLRWDKDFNVLGESDVTDSRTFQVLKANPNPISDPFVNSLPHSYNRAFSPRVGFAYDLTGAGTHVVRGGFGLYYGNTFQNIPLFMEQQANDTIFQTVLSLSGSDVVPGTGIPLDQWRYGVDPFPTLPGPTGTLASRSVGRLIDPRYQPPVAEEFNLGYSWALNNASSIEVEYTHVLGLHENKTINIDQRISKGIDNSGVPCTGDDIPAGCNASYGDVILSRPLDTYTGSQFASVRVEESINRNRYDGVNFSYRRRMSSHFSLNANYTLSWAYGYDGGGGPNTIFRNYARDGYHPLSPQEWGPSTNDERHHVTVSGAFELPHGFQLSPIMQIGSARPYQLSNSNNPLNPGGGTATAVLVPTNDPTNYFAYANDDVGARVCYYVTQSCTVAKYAPLRGDAFFQLDLRLAKNFKLGEKMNLQLVGQAFNITNQANYGNNFGGDVADAASFARPVGFINPSSTTTPRSVWGEFGVRFSF
jgi:outer membrane receptor protein involved in Fe transport